MAVAYFPSMASVDSYVVTLYSETVQEIEGK